MIFRSTCFIFRKKKSKCETKKTLTGQQLEYFEANFRFLLILFIHVVSVLIITNIKNAQFYAFHLQSAMKSLFSIEMMDLYINKFISLVRNYKHTYII